MIQVTQTIVRLLSELDLKQAAREQPPEFCMTICATEGRDVKPLVTLREALADPALLGHVLGGDTWAAWRVLLIAAVGEALTDYERALFAKLTGRECEPGRRVEELIGRRRPARRQVARDVYARRLCRWLV